MAKKILIVEDEKFLADMYQIKFKSEGYKIFLASDGEMGVELAKKEKPDLILLDLVLPQMNGYQVLEKLRQDPETKKIIIYVLSNLGQEEEINEATEKGADGFLIKANITPRELADYVKRIFAGEKIKIKEI